ncbi:hypothetical protein HMPREF6485_2766 [Segatella buccae ATCC 33574]|uniref:Uncharacterized protein n=1 Tax=Segatella buccae ATCC 33574 TaxID=873513 RepID=E6KAX9_9BACT|nr:hypothetical protein HMPREF6485_2766 [Segatella buccae ATCC 33574]
MFKGSFSYPARLSGNRGAVIKKIPAGDWPAGSVLYLFDLEQFVFLI